MNRSILTLFIVLFLSNTALAQTTDQLMSLRPGFNFISFTIVPDVTPEQLKQNNPMFVEDVYSYSAAAGSFLSLSEGTLSSLAAGKGYILKSKSEGTITISGNPVNLLPDISLKFGFNLFGISQSVSQTTFSGLMKSFGIIKGLYKWSPAAGSFIQVITSSDGTPQQLDGADPQFKTGESYFVNVYDNTTLRFVGGALSFTGGNAPVPPNFIITGSIPVLGTPVNESDNRMIAFGTNYEMSVYDSNSMTEIVGSALVISGTAYTATFPAGNASVTALMIVKDKTKGKIVYSALIGDLPTASAMSLASVSQITVSGVNLTGESTAIATLRKDKNIPLPSVPVISTVTTMSEVIKTSVENAVTSSTVSAVTNAVDAVQTVLKDANVSESVKSAVLVTFDLKLQDIFNAFVVAVKEASSLVNTKIGTTSISVAGKIINASSTTADITSAINGVNIITITAVTNPGDIAVANGTPAANISFPANVFVTKSNGTTVAASVIWSITSTPAYNATTSGTYTFTGNVSGTVLTAKVNVVVGAVIQTVVTPTFNVESGTYTSIQNVTIACATTGASIYYTTDGSNPTTSSTVYTSAIKISAPTTIKAFAVKDGMTNSAITVAMYTINIPPPSTPTLTVDLGDGIMLEMIKIPSAVQSFQMGSPVTESDRSLDEAAHKVSFSKNYYMGKYEVTQEQWLKVYGGWPGNAPSQGVGNKYPACNVSYNDITSPTTGFLAKINTKCPSGYSGFRLPTEAEWEYAARAGTLTGVYWGDDSSYKLINDYAWYNGNSNFANHPSGEKSPNAFGLYDISGNVWEWCSDWYGDYGSSEITDPSGSSWGTYRVIRGGGWGGGAKFCRSASRHYLIPSDRGNGSYGFRLALSSDQTPPPSKVESPSISPTGGTFTSSQNLTISCNTAGASIFYTTDGSDPTSSSMVYTSAIKISSTTTIKAFAVKEGMTDSAITIAMYTINIPSPSVQTLTLDLGSGVMLEMIKIPAGTFMMGSSLNEMGRFDDEGPTHLVTITKDFYIGKYEVTQGQWKAIMNGANPSSFKTGDNYPVEKISWNSICQTGGFLAKLNALKPSGYSGFRLPTEAEWEYACRAGTTTSYYWGDDPSYILIRDYAWTGFNAEYKTHPVGSAPGLAKGINVANIFGLYDMVGNVNEWCNDLYDFNYYSTSPAIDPTGPTDSDKYTYRTLRGGGWQNGHRSADRGPSLPTFTHPTIGFRLVLTLSENEPSGVTTGKVETPIFTPTGDNNFSATQKVTISCATFGADIYYTIDGMSMKYTNAITVPTTTTINAIAIKAGMTNSDIATAKFTINLPPPEIITINLSSDVNIEMIKIPAGTFQMGSPESEAYRNEGEKLHTVTITKDFYMGKYEVTQGQWKAIMNGVNPSYFKSGDNYPVDSVSWDDICETGGFLTKINALKPSGYSGFRLPTEAEWEYAGRASTTTNYYWGIKYDRDYSWNGENSNYKTHPVGSAPGLAKGINVANIFGLYDISGNVIEWCNDWHASDYYSSSPINDPAGPLTGESRIVRGGHYSCGANPFRLANRDYYSTPSTRNSHTGFRLVLSAGQ